MSYLSTHWLAFTLMAIAVMLAAFALLRRLARPGSRSLLVFSAAVFLIGLGGLHFLRGDWPAWRTFRQMRARTSHTYNATTAEQVVAAIPGFLQEAEHLVAELRRRLA